MNDHKTFMESHMLHPPFIKKRHATLNISPTYIIFYGSTAYMCNIVPFYAQGSTVTNL